MSDENIIAQFVDNEAKLAKAILDGVEDAQITEDMGFDQAQIDKMKQKVSLLKGEDEEVAEESTPEQEGEEVVNETVTQDEEAQTGSVESSIQGFSAPVDTTTPEETVEDKGTESAA